MADYDIPPGYASVWYLICMFGLVTVARKRKRKFCNTNSCLSNLRLLTCDVNARAANRTVTFVSDVEMGNATDYGVYFDNLNLLFFNITTDELQRGSISLSCCKEIFRSPCFGCLPGSKAELWVAAFGSSLRGSSSRKWFVLIIAGTPSAHEDVETIHPSSGAWFVFPAPTCVINLQQ